jgi:hypothetical protein
MKRLIERYRLWWTSVKKSTDALLDVFRPSGHVEALLYYAHGPRKGELYKSYKGRNIITSWLSLGGAAPTSGRDMMRRILIPTGFPESLAADPNCVVQQMQLGSGTTAETASDTSLVTPIAGSEKDISAVTLDGTSPFVTFITEYDESEVNQTISEAALLSNRSPQDFIARKTFGSFTKTNEFTLQIRWQIRF